MKKGFTVIELVATLAILSIVLSLTFGGYKVYEGFKRDIEVERFLYELEDSLCFGREYCISNGVTGTVYIEENEENIKVTFKDNRGYLVEKKLSKALEMDKSSGHTLPIVKRFNIRGDGVMDEGSVLFIDRQNKRYKITINPAVYQIYVGEG